MTRFESRARASRSRRYESNVSRSEWSSWMALFQNATCFRMKPGTKSRSPTPASRTGESHGNQRNGPCIGSLVTSGGFGIFFGWKTPSFRHASAENLLHIVARVKIRIGPNRNCLFVLPRLRTVRGVPGFHHSHERLRTSPMKNNFRRFVFGRSVAYHSICGSMSANHQTAQLQRNKRVTHTSDPPSYSKKRPHK